jgi:hypothetical protein
MAMPGIDVVVRCMIGAIANLPAAVNVPTK